MSDKSGATWPLTLGYVAAAVGLPSAIAALRWPDIQKHPLEGGLLLAGLAVVFGVAGFVHQLWAKKYNDRLIDAVAAMVDVRTSRFWRQYRKRMLDHVRFVDQRGLVGYFYDPELSDVYVDVTLQAASSPDVSSSVVADLPAAGERMTIDAFLGRPQPRVIAIIGAPGSGKTTLLRHTALRLCGRRRIGRGRTVPILLYLRDHVPAITANPEITLRELQNEAVLGRFDLTDPAGWLEQRLKAGRCVVMLDGLDEVAVAEDRRTVSDWVRRQVSRYPDNDFLLTSRPLGYESAPVQGAIRVLASPFTTAQVERFARAWYLAEERRSTGTDDANIARRADAAANDLLSRLRANPSLHALTANPLLLTMIATVHRHMAALPGSRAQLYDQICQVLLWRRQEAKRLPSRLRGDQQHRLVQALGYSMMTDKVRDLSAAAALSVIRPVLRRIDRDLAPEDVLGDLASSGLFAERESGVYAFAHLTFQEYLAAAHIKDRHLEKVLVKNVADSWWRETTLLYVAGADASAIVSACLADITLPTLTLAYDCAAQASTLSPDLRDKLDELLAEVHDVSRDVRELMTGVLVTRVLHDVIETDGGTLICAQQVPNRIYRLFLEDMALRGTPMPPDIGPGQNEEPDAPARGMRGDDAIHFARWAGARTGGQIGCRLPTAEEFTDLAVKDVVPPDQTCWLTRPEMDLPYTPRIPSAPPSWLDRVQGDFAAAPLALGVFPLVTHACVAIDQLLRLHPDQPLPYQPADVLSALQAVVRYRQRKDLAAFITEILRNFAAAGTLLSRNVRRPNEVPYLVGVIKRDLLCATQIANACIPLGLSWDEDLALADDLGFGASLYTLNEAAFHPQRTPSRGQDRDLDAGMRRACNSVLGARFNAALNMNGYPDTHRLYGEDTAAPAIHPREALGLRFRSGMPEAATMLDPEALSSGADLATQQLMGHIPQNPLRGLLITRFTAAMRDVSLRDRLVSSRAARRARILALSLAGEGVPESGASWGGQFITIAATVTWLEMRHAGEIEAPETIVLAVE